MAILIGIWESIFVLLIIVCLTTLIVQWYWRRRLVAIRQVDDRQQQTEIYDLIRAFRHQALKCLRPIKDNLHQIRAKMPDVAEAAEWPRLVATSLEEVEKYEWRLTRLIENMAFVSRLEVQNLNLSFSDVKLDVIISDVVSEFQDSSEVKGIELAWSANPESFPRITANAESIRQVFINLIDNAIKYCQNGDEIDIVLKADEGKNVIYAQVSDTGQGIPEDDLKHIFDKGYTVEEARGRQPKAGSQGLGLYIAKLVVEKHKGIIKVTSELGEGTTFIITLPIQRI